MWLNNTHTIQSKNVSSEETYGEEICQAMRDEEVGNCIP
jgi:hypothetical protein